VKGMTELEMRTEQGLDVQQARLAALIEGDYDYQRLRRGQVCEATVLVVAEDCVIVDLGSKRDGIVPPGDLDRVDDEYRKGIRVGDRVPVSVRDASEAREQVIVSLSRGLARQDWLRAGKLLEREEVCEAEVVGVNRGGVLVQFGRIRGFVPNSHLLAIPRGLRGDRLRQAKLDLVGQTLSLVVLEVEQRRRRLVLSERAAKRHIRRRLFDELVEGEVRTGTVRNLVDFGAFVDLGGVDGLIHISELDWRHIQHPSEVLSVGDSLDVYVLSVDRERERIGLSRKRLLPDPWVVVTESLEEGQIVDGVVTRTASYGVFVDVGQGVEGLLHVSEMPDQKGPDSGLEPGSQVRVRVLGVDNWRRRIALSLRQVENVTFLPTVWPLGRKFAQRDTSVQSWQAGR
jgi:small subunit ribosomal protein S1